MWSMEWIALSGFRNNKNIVAGLKCPTPSTPHPRLHPSTPSRVNVKWHRQTDSIVDVLSVHWEHKEAAQMVKQRLCSYFLGWEREEGREGEIEKKKDCMQLQPLSSAAWPVAIATWLCIPFHLPFLINSHSCFSLANLPLSWNAWPLRLTYLRCFREDCCHVCFKSFDINFTKGILRSILILVYTSANYYSTVSERSNYKSPWWNKTHVVLQRHYLPSNAD